MLPRDRPARPARAFERGKTCVVPGRGSDATQPILLMHLRTLSFVALCALAVPSGPAFAQGRVFSGAPAASWIAPPAVPGDSAVVFHARRTFDLPSRPERFVVHVSAD